MPWKSRWSWPRFVNTATAKCVPTTRSSARAWEETSMATARAPDARAVAPAPPAGRAPRVSSGCPTTCPAPEHGQPAPDSTAPQQVGDGGLAVGAGDADHRERRSTGRPRRWRRPRPWPRRASDTSICGTSRPSRCSTSSATAPRATASPAKACPSTCWPGTQQNRLPVRGAPRVVDDPADLGVGLAAGACVHDDGRAEAAVELLRQLPEPHRPPRRRLVTHCRPPVATGRPAEPRPAAGARGAGGGRGRRRTGGAAGGRAAPGGGRRRGGRRGWRGGDSWSSW